MSWLAVMALVAALWCAADLLLVGVWISVARVLRRRRGSVAQAAAGYLAEAGSRPQHSHPMAAGPFSRH
jgi:hypothetical protein